jgi:mono/diheme cytochrome c family protein
MYLRFNQIFNAKTHRHKGAKEISSQKHAASLRLCIFAFGLMFLSSCSGLAGEPQIVATIPPPTPAPTEVGHPVTPPDVALGAAIFADRCISCHGETGAGDGALVRTGQIPSAGNFTDPATGEAQRPTEWFATITNGRIEKLMPPWRDALTEAERWAVGMYTYTLHYDAEVVARGAELYAQHCASCHGESGRGDGPEAANLLDDPGDLTNLEKMTLNSDRVLYNIVTEGVGGMEGFADELPEADRWAVSYYARTLSLSNPESIGVTLAAQPAATPEVAVETTVEAAPAGMVTGVVTNGTAGNEVPADLEVNLFRLDPEFNRTDFATTIDANNAFSFADVPIDPESTYVVAITYRDRIFTSDVVLGEGESLNLPVTIYELTEDPEVLSVAGMVTRINVVDDRLEVAQVFNIANNSDRAFSTSQTTEDGRPISVAITLPPGAVMFNDNQRYVLLQDQFTVLDTMPVMPGEENVIQLVYLIDYNGGAIIEQPLNYALNGPARVLLFPPNIQLASEQLAPRGEEVLGGVTYQSYGSEMTLAAGDVIRYELSGASATPEERPEAGVVSSNNLPLIILIVIGAQVIIIGTLYWLYSRRQRGRKPISGEQPLMDALIRQIAELDAISAPAHGFQGAASHIDGEEFLSQ